MDSFKCWWYTWSSTNTSSWEVCCWDKYSDGYHGAALVQLRSLLLEVYEFHSHSSTIRPLHSACILTQVHEAASLLPGILLPKRNLEKGSEWGKKSYRNSWSWGDKYSSSPSPIIHLNLYFGIYFGKDQLHPHLMISRHSMCDFSSHLVIPRNTELKVSL